MQFCFYSLKPLLPKLERAFEPTADCAKMWVLLGGPAWAPGCAFLGVPGDGDGAGLKALARLFSLVLGRQCQLSPLSLAQPLPPHLYKVGVLLVWLVSLC